MQFVVKFAGIVTIALLFASCYSDVPGLPTPEEVEKYEFCQYQGKDKLECESTYVISKSECNIIKGSLFTDKDCKIPVSPESK